MLLLGLLSLCWARAALAGLLWAGRLCLLWPCPLPGLRAGAKTQSLQADSGWAQLATIPVPTGPVLLLLPLWTLCPRGLPQLCLLGPVTETLILVQFWGPRGFQELLLLRGLRGLAVSILVLVLVLVRNMPVSLLTASLPGSLRLVFQAPLWGEPQEASRPCLLGFLLKRAELLMLLVAARPAGDLA